MNGAERELRKRIDELEKENRCLLMEREKAYRNALLAKLFFASADFDLTRPDFKRLTGVEFKGEWFFVITFHEKRHSDKLLEFDNDGRITGIEDQGPSPDDMEKLIEGCIPPRHIVLTANVYGQIFCVVNYQGYTGLSQAAEMEISRFTAKRLEKKIRRFLNDKNDLRDRKS